MGYDYGWFTLHVKVARYTLTVLLSTKTVTVEIGFFLQVKPYWVGQQNFYLVK